MSMVLVPNHVRDAINAKLDKALAECPQAEPDRELFYLQLLYHYNNHGEVPDFDLTKRDSN